MKKVIFLLLVFAGFMACENESIEELPQEVSKTEGISAKQNNKIDVCHYDADNDSWHMINISANAWKGHEKHGDVLLSGNYLVKMWDYWGDGWQTIGCAGQPQPGVQVDIDGTIVEFGLCDLYCGVGNTFECTTDGSYPGYYGETTITIPVGAAAVSWYFPGDYYDEMQMEVYRPDGSLLYYMGYGMSEGILPIYLCGNEDSAKSRRQSNLSTRKSPDLKRVKPVKN